MNFNLLDLKKLEITTYKLNTMSVEEFKERFKDRSLVIWCKARSFEKSLDDIINGSRYSKSMTPSINGTLLIVHSIEGDNCKVSAIDLRLGYIYSKWNVDSLNSTEISIEDILKLFKTFTRRVYSNSTNIYVVDSPSFSTDARLGEGFCFRTLLGDFRDIVLNINTTYKELKNTIDSKITYQPQLKTTSTYEAHPYIAFNDTKTTWKISDGNKVIYSSYKIKGRLPKLVEGDRDAAYTDVYSLTIDDYKELIKKIEEWKTVRRESLLRYQKLINKISIVDEGRDDSLSLSQYISAVNE